MRTNIIIILYNRTKTKKNYVNFVKTVNLGVWTFYENMVLID